MGCPAEVVIGNDLVFSICTHDPDTGVLTDADTVPTYRIYEGETATPILTGSMAKLDDAGTTGFYTELIECTSGNGFDAETTYTVYIQATVDGDTGGIAFGFRAITDIWSRSSRTLTQSGSSIAAIVSGTTVTVHRGDTATIAITGLGDISGRSKLWFTAKSEKATTTDAAADIHVEETDGLISIGGAAASESTHGAIAVNDESAGNITITIKPAATDDLTEPINGGYWESCTASASTHWAYARQAVLSLQHRPSDGVSV